MPHPKRPELRCEGRLLWLTDALAGGGRHTSGQGACGWRGTLPHANADLFRLIRN